LIYNRKASNVLRTLVKRERKSFQSRFVPRSTCVGDAVSAQKAAAEARRRSAAGYSGSTVVVAAAMAAVVVFLAAGVVALVVRHLQRRRRSKQPALVDIRQVHARADLPINAAALLL